MVLKGTLVAEDGPELLRQLRTGGEPARGGPAASQHKHEHRQQILGCEIQGGVSSFND